MFRHHPGQVRHTLYNHIKVLEDNAMLWYNKSVNLYQAESKWTRFRGEHDESEKSIGNFFDDWHNYIYLIVGNIRKSYNPLKQGAGVAFTYWKNGGN